MKIRVVDAAYARDLLTVFFRSDDNWRLTPGCILKSGEVTIRFKTMGHLFIPDPSPDNLELYAFAGESDFPPEKLIGREYEIIP